MSEVVELETAKLERFSKEMKEIVDEIVKIERKWLLGAATIQSAHDDLLRILDLIENLTEKAQKLNLFDKYDMVKFRLDISRAKIKKALRGDWGE